jgi:8-oxo-dGTP diphosphatase
MLEVTCGIIVNQNKILVTQRSEKMKLPLKWEFPGGKIEENETAEECILREIKEELNLEIEILKRLSASQYDYGTFKINLIPFIAKYQNGVIILAEHKDFKWIEAKDLLSLDWAPADIPILNEFLKDYYDGTWAL